MTRPRVLFLCTGNAARSQMAEAFLRPLAPDRFAAFSGGLDARGINPLSIAVMAERGIDISAQRSMSISVTCISATSSPSAIALSAPARRCPAWARACTGRFPTWLPQRARKRSAWRSFARSATRSGRASAHGSRTTVALQEAASDRAVLSEAPGE